MGCSSAAAPTGDAEPTVVPRPRRRTAIAVNTAVFATLFALLFVARASASPAHGAVHGRLRRRLLSGARRARLVGPLRRLDVLGTTRRERPGYLTLFTLEGDNWPQPGREPVIRNLLVRPLSSDCFDVDVRLTSFFPRQNWQQAGLLLLEDTTLTGRSARVSIGYNDFSGGFPQTREVIVQAITSLGMRSGKPEEFVHRRLFVVDSATDTLVRQNLESSALRIEKRGAHLRLLYSAGPLKNAPFKEVGERGLRLSAGIRGAVRHQGIRQPVGRRARLRRGVQPVGSVMLPVSS